MRVGQTNEASLRVGGSTSAARCLGRKLGATRLALVVVVVQFTPLFALASPRIVLREHAGQQIFEVSGIAEPLAAHLKGRNVPEATLSRLLRVFVDADGPQAQPAMLGNLRFDNGRLIFEPRFPLRPGVTYRAVFDATSLAPTLTSASAKKDIVLERIFTVPMRSTVATVVKDIYPTRATLPENQLKFYVHFSAPMAQGNSYQHVRLLDGSGKEIDLPFVNVGQELWNRQGTRITLLLDPGRIKRGLKPREDLGPILRQGHSYTLVIDDSWIDATGQQIGKSYRKGFRVVAPDDMQPDTEKWRVQAPRAHTLAPLRIDFQEPLDHAMLQRALEVVDGQGRPLVGAVRVQQNEQRWLFTPDKPWKSGPHNILIDTSLEDLAGNSIARPFEVDVFEEVTTVIDRARISAPFEVR